MTYLHSFTRVSLCTLTALTIMSRVSLAGQDVPITLNQFVMMDTPKMESLISSSIDDRQQDDQAYYENVAEVLAFKILPHPRLTERSASLNRLASRLEESDMWLMIYEKAADKLIGACKDSETAAGKATALSGLANLVTEVRNKQGDGYKDILKKVSEANIQVSKEAADYARDSVRYLPSPSAEAKLSLKSLL